MPTIKRVGNNLREWEVKPPRSTQIDWERPSTRGLKHLLLFNDLGSPNFAFDISSKRMFSKYPNDAGILQQSPFVHPFGSGIKFDSSVQLGLNAQNLKISNGDFGFLVFFHQTTVDNGRILSISDGANQKVTLTVALANSLLQLSVINAANSSSSIASTPNNSILANEYMWAAGGFSNGKAYLSTGKIRSPLTSWTVGGVMTGSNGNRLNFHIGASSSSGNPFKGTIAYVAFWDRFVDIGEMNRLIARPYSIMGRTSPIARTLPATITRRMWRVKPPRGSVIDRTHPSAHSIKHLLLFNELGSISQAFDIASRRIFTGSTETGLTTIGTTSFIQPHGSAVELTGYPYKYLRSQNLPPSNSDFGFLIFFRAKIVPGGTFFYMYNISIPSIAIGLDYQGGASQRFDLTIRNDASVSSSITTATGSVIDDQYSWVAGGIRNNRPYIATGKIGNPLTSYLQGGPVSGALMPRNDIFIGSSAFNVAIAYVAMWDRFIDVGEMNRLTAQPYSIIRADRPSIMYPMVTSGQQIHLSGPPHPSTTIRRAWTVKPPRGSIIDRENASTHLLKHLLLFNDFGSLNHTFDIASKVMLSAPSGQVFRRVPFIHPHGSSLGFYSSADLGMNATNLSPSSGDFGFLAFIYTDIDANGFVFKMLSGGYGSDAFAALEYRSTSKYLRFVIMDSTLSFSATAQTPNASIEMDKYYWVAGGIRNGRPHITIGSMQSPLTAWITGAVMSGSNGKRINLNVGGNDEPFGGSIAYLAMWDRFVDIAEMNRLISQPYSIIKRVHRPAVFVPELIQGQQLYIYGETASYKTSHQAWRVKPPRGAEIDRNNPSSRLIKHLILFNDLGATGYAFDVAYKAMFKQYVTSGTFQREAFPHPHGTGIKFGSGSVYGLNLSNIRPSNGDFGFLIYFKNDSNGGVLLDVNNGTSSVVYLSNSIIADRIEMTIRNEASTSVSTVNSPTGGVVASLYHWVAGGIQNGVPYIQTGRFDYGSLTQVSKITSWRVGTAITGPNGARRHIWIGSNISVPTPYDGTIAYIGLWDRFIDIAEMNRLLINPYSIIRPIETTIKYQFGVQRDGQQLYITGRAATSTGQQIHLTGIALLSEGTTQVYIYGFTIPQAAGQQIHLIGLPPTFPHSSGALIYVRGLSLPGAGLSRIVYNVTAVEGPVTGSWARLFGRLVVDVSTILRENISEQETLLVIQQITEGWNWSENVTPIVNSCPIPATTLINSTTLYPC